MRADEARALESCKSFAALLPEVGEAPITAREERLMVMAMRAIILELGWRWNREETRSERGRE